MAIVSLPPELSPTSSLTCALCHNKIPPDKATAGMLDADGQQAFSCISHLSELEKLINGWADFYSELCLKNIMQGGHNAQPYC